ncbi:hypothetical protein LCGC14_1725790 [marine sediment metagenome]|uniref:Uncharacterized protein n=1 Tax=marine sediment metagenome TaxID=412755 RepID=A0A0F9HB59_9ZZZZ
MAIEAIFDIGVDQIELRTKTNGDQTLTIEIKEKEG